ncbi:MAG: hypothetical protein AB7T06_40395 [Kofleriaceae bacterium]
MTTVTHDDLEIFDFALKLAEVAGFARRGSADSVATFNAVPRELVERVAQLEHRNPLFRRELRRVFDFQPGAN